MNYQIIKNNNKNSIIKFNMYTKQFNSCGKLLIAMKLITRLLRNKIK